MSENIRLEGFTLTVKDVNRSIEYYTKKLGFECKWNAAPNFALISLGEGSRSIGLLAFSEAEKEGAIETTAEQKRGIHIEISTDNLDSLYEELLLKGIEFDAPPHDEPWERSATAFDPDGYSVEFSEGRRGKNKIKKE